MIKIFNTKNPTTLQKSTPKLIACTENDKNAVGGFLPLITQYGSTVYIGMAMGGSALYIAIHKEISIITFNFNSICLLRTSRWRTCEKVTACKKMDENITGGVKYR